MPRIRTIKPEFFKHEDLFIAEQEEKLPLRISFIGLWTVADREGRFKWRPNTLKLDCLPFDKCDFSRVLDALATRGFIEEYTSEDGERYGVIHSFVEHQVINNRESKSLIPSVFDACITRDPRGLSMHKGKGKERKGKEAASETEIDNLFPEITDRQLVDDWKKVRKAKKLPITKSAIEGIVREAGKAGWTIEQVVRKCCEKGWAGFEAKWVEGEAKPDIDGKFNMDNFLKTVGGY